MNADYTQNLRYKLQKRFRRVNSAGWVVFHTSLQQFWHYLHSVAVFNGILADLERRCGPYEAEAEKIFSEHQQLQFQNELEAVGISYLVVKKCVESDYEQPEVKIGYPYGYSTNDDAIDFFRSYFVEPLYEYIDEQLDDRRAMLSLLRRYKQKCEWFQRDRLFEIWAADPRRGERTLAQHLYEYLHDQGIDIHIEPLSASGEIDVISAQQSEEPLLADAKIFNPDGGQDKGYIAKGVAQMYRYTVDYNESVGYLVIYKTWPHDLALALTDQSLSVPFLEYNNKTIFLIVVDIYPHEEPASKRGRLKQIEITERDLIAVVED